MTPISPARVAPRAAGSATVPVRPAEVPTGPRHLHADPGHDPDPTAVVVLHWPREAEVRERLRALGAPRLLLADPAHPLPLADDPDEDWMFASGDDDELGRRVRALERRPRTRPVPDAPWIDSDDLLRYDGSWVALAPGEAEVMRVLLRRMGTCVATDDLAPDPDRRSSLRGRLKRLRQRIRPLGLVITTVRSRGVVLSRPAELT